MESHASKYMPPKKRTSLECQVKLAAISNRNSLVRSSVFDLFVSHDQGSFQRIPYTLQPFEDLHEEVVAAALNPPILSPFPRVGNGAAVAVAQGAAALSSVFSLFGLGGGLSPSSSGAGGECGDDAAATREDEAKTAAKLDRWLAEVGARSIACRVRRLSS